MLNVGVEWELEGDRLCSFSLYLMYIKCAGQLSLSSVCFMFRLDVRKKVFFTIRVMRHWNRLPRDVVNVPSLDTSSVRLDGARSNLIKLYMSLLNAGSWTR